ncbi:hypothetical protein B0J11DRAFT_515088 [Dendryphion nanum]|uniref:Heterokaryon incompatibility domain-containing protein n=1 Tax=Dendryphion nanum TaxID=256645 RepID=A0A9P9EKF4_9PLEO|nr:hypothetical protein B0J11DRAFT_515088 [Dendryphion nanum]
MTAPPIALADPGFAESNGLPRFPSHEWDALGLIFKRKVFQRIWIIQELALARDVEMMCGSHAMSFIDLALASRIIVDRGWFRFFIKEYGEDCRPNFAANHFNRQLLISSGKQQSLLFLLGVTRRFQATHPVDKIYGLLGLSQVKGQQLDATPLTPALIPDYTKSTEEVYRDITFHLMVSENSLDLLSTVEDKSVRKLKQLPSWVPDYSTWQNITILGLNQGIPYIASGNSPVSITRSGRSNETLHTKAIRLDNIGSVSRPWLAEDHYFNIFHDWCEFLNQQLILTNQLNLVKSNRAIARALIGDFAVTSAQYPAPEDEYFKHFLSFLQHHFQMSGPDMNESQFGGDYSIYLESFHHFGFGRRAFISKEGRIGFGHISVQEGDGIYLLSGGRTPFILRPVADGESFEFLGESYLHGVMNGEAVPSDETKWTTIDIV